MANEKRLTEQDKFAYCAIEGFIKDHGYPPSVRDLCRMTGKKSSATIQYRLKSLEQKGYIKITNGESGSIRILKGIEGNPNVESVPVVHGRWEHAEYHGFLRCSECKDVYIDDTWVADGKWNYCPNCGAKMDGDGNG